MVESPQFSTSQIEESPVVIPLIFLTSAVGLRENGLQIATFPVLVERRQPRFARLGIVHPVHAPVLLAGKILAKVQEQIVTGHGPARKKIVTHPAAGDTNGKEFQLSFFMTTFLNPALVLTLQTGKRSLCA